MSSATQPPDDRPEKLKKITELRNRILQLVGPNHGEELTQIMAELRALHGSPVPAERPREDAAEALVRKFVKK
jgi:hypothetical protein